MEDSGPKHNILEVGVGTNFEGVIFDSTEVTFDSSADVFDNAKLHLIFNLDFLHHSTLRTWRRLFEPHGSYLLVQGGIGGSSAITQHIMTSLAPLASWTEAARELQLLLDLKLTRQYARKNTLVRPPYLTSVARTYREKKAGTGKTPTPKVYLQGNDVAWREAMHSTSTTTLLFAFLVGPGEGSQLDHWIVIKASLEDHSITTYDTYGSRSMYNAAAAKEAHQVVDFCTEWFNAAPHWSPANANAIATWRVVFDQGPKHPTEDCGVCAPQTIYLILMTVGIVLPRCYGEDLRCSLAHLALDFAQRYRQFVRELVTFIDL